MAVCVPRRREGLGSRRELLGAALARLLGAHALSCREMVRVGHAGYLSGFRALGQGSGFVQPHEIEALERLLLASENCDKH